MGVESPVFIHHEASSGDGFHRSLSPRLRSRSELRFIDTLFDRQHRLVESDDRQPMRLPDPGFPSVRNAFFREKDLEILHATTKDRE